MKPIPLQQRGIAASRLILGCMGLGGERNVAPIEEQDVNHGRAAVEAALAAGINMFDHADIYKLGKAEQVFGRILSEDASLREKIILQSKCGIRAKEWSGLPFKRYDFSASHIVASVDGILERLGTDYLDVLLLHRPDPLMDPEEVGEAIRTLKAAGKVRHFGVSNMSAGQIRLLQSETDEPFLVNQLELSLRHIGWLESGIHVNQPAAAGDYFPEGTLEYCRLQRIQLQSWGALAQGAYTSGAGDHRDERTMRTTRCVEKLAAHYGVRPEAIVLAWLMRHPAGIQPIVGTSNPDRIAACAAATSIALTGDEWYELYVSSRGAEMP